MRTIFVLTLLAALLVVPAAQAQFVNAAMTLEATAPESVFGPDAEQQTAPAQAKYVADLTAYTNLVGVPVTFTVTEAPEWLAVTPSPATAVFTSSTPSQAFFSMVPFKVIMTLDPAFEGEAIGEVEITAATMVQSPQKPAIATMKIPVQAIVPTEEACDETHALLAAEEPATEEPQTVTVQNAGVQTLASPAALGGFALVGAGVGLVLRKRFG